MAELKIAIDFGHGLSVDAGADGILTEETVIAAYGEALISRLGNYADVEIVRVRPDSATSVNDSLNKRANKANAQACDVFLSLHANKGGGTGCEAFGANSASNAVAAEILSNLSGLGFKNRGVKTADLSVIRRSSVPVTVLVEPFFVDSAADVSLYNKVGVAAIGKVIADAVMRRRFTDKEGKAVKAVEPQVLATELLKPVKSPSNLNQGGRNQSRFDLYFDPNKPIEPETWSITTSEDAAAVIEATFDARRYPETAEICRLAVFQAEGEPLQFKARLALGNGNIDYSLILTAIRSPYKEQVTLNAVVKQYVFDRPLALKNASQIQSATGGNIEGDLDEIVGTVVKPGRFAAALKKGRKLVQKPDGGILVIGQNGEWAVVVRQLPNPGDCIKFEFGVRSQEEKDLANTTEVKNSNPLVNPVTGESGKVKPAATDGVDKKVAKTLYKTMVAAGYSDVVARAVVAYHCTECSSYKDWDKVQNSGLSSGILQWTKDGCEGVAAFKGSSNAEKYEFCKANISNLELQCSALVQYLRVQESRGHVNRYRAKVGGLAEARTAIEREFMIYAGAVYYPAFSLKQNPWDSKIGGNNITLRDVATGKYKMPFALKEMERLLS